jgi:glycosyltransferase involved in cell wall biosynthesis
MARILTFSLTYYPRPIGGAEVAIKEITDRQDADDLQFEMVTLRFDRELPNEEQVGNVYVYRLGFTKQGPSARELTQWPLKLNKLLFPFMAAWKAHRLHRAKPYDGIWAMMANFSGFAAMFFKTLNPRVPYLLTLQEGDPIDEILHKVRFVRPFFNRIFTKADFVQTISTYLASWARQMNYEGPLEVVPNAVNTEHFSQSYSDDELEQVRQQLGKGTDDYYLITTSRLVKKNACDDVIRALAQLPPHVHFIILGTGPDEAQLKQLAHDEEVQERVQFLGQVDHEDMPKYLQACDIFIRPSRSEGMGNSFVEAMAAGLPVIATQVGGIADFLFDPERDPNATSTGKAVDPDNPHEIAEAVEWFQTHAKERTQIVENAKELVFSQYDWDRIAHDMHDRVFRPLLDSDT